MDTKKDSKIPNYGSLLSLRENKVVVGAKQLRKALQKGQAKCVYLAQNADPALTEPLEGLSQGLGRPVVWVRSMADLGRACGIDVGAVAAAIVDP